MSKRDDAELDDWPRDEYGPDDLKNGVRGKHLEQFRAGTNLILLDPDVAKAFPTSQAVNDALRLVIQLAKTPARPRRSSKRRVHA